MSEQPFNHAGFSHLLAQGRLMAARCQNCGQVWLPPRPLCPACHAERMAWEALSGSGTLEGFTAIHVGLSEMQALGYSREQPYGVAVARLVEGPLISGQLTDASLSQPERLKIGAPVRATFIDRPPRGVVLGFELLGA